MSLRKQATAGMVWTFAQQFGNQIVGFVVSLVLARILLPAEFGLIGMIAIFYSVGKSLIDSGLTQSLIRSKKVDQVDFSTVFYFNLAVSILIYLLIFISAPLISDFYDQSVLIQIIRVYCLTFIVDAFSAVQIARLTKNMQFKTQTLVVIPSTILGGIVGVTMAYNGFGVWSLVWSNIASSIGSTIQFWIYSKWTPSFTFNVKVFKEHFNFGYKIMLSSLLEKVFNNIYLIIIGRFFSPAQVGYYTRAETMKQLPVTNISNTLNKVTYPLFSTIQDDGVRLKRVYKQLMQMVVFVIAPVLIFMAVLAEPIFVFLFTDKWLPAVPYFQILCATGILYPVHAYNLNVLKVKGRSDLVLKLAVYKKILTVVGIIIGLQYGIFGLLYARVALSFISFIINAHYTDRFIGYSALEQLWDVVPILLTGLLAGGLAFFGDYFLYDYADVLRIIGGGIIGVSSYFLFSYFFRIRSLKDFRTLVKKKL